MSLYITGRIDDDGSFSSGYSGSSEPLVPEVEGLYPGYIDSENTITSAWIWWDNHLNPEIRHGYETTEILLQFSEESYKNYGDLKAYLKFGTEGTEPLSESKCWISSGDPQGNSVQGSNPADINSTMTRFRWYNESLVDTVPEHSKFSLFITGDEGSPLTHYSYPVTLR